MATEPGGERIRRSLLFVPAVRPDRFPKALATGADAVCLDLEDGVAFAAKETARERAFALLAGREPTAAEVSLRVNDVKTELGRADLAALVEAGVRPDALMLPKVAGGGEVREVEAALAPLGAALPLIVQLETAAGVLAAAEIAAASSNVSAVFFGAIDLSADLGCAVEWEALLYARSRVVLAAGAAGVSALDSPFMDVPAVEALADESRRVRRLGFAGKAAIHPTQVPVIQRAFSPLGRGAGVGAEDRGGLREPAGGRAAGRRPAHRAPGRPGRAAQPANRRPARGRRRSGPLRPAGGRVCACFKRGGPAARRGRRLQPAAPAHRVLPVELAADLARAAVDEKAVGAKRPFTESAVGHLGGKLSSVSYRRMSHLMNRRPQPVGLLSGRPRRQAKAHMAGDPLAHLEPSRMHRWRLVLRRAVDNRRERPNVVSARERSGLASTQARCSWYNGDY